MDVERIMVFIDGPNLSAAAYEAKIRIDFEKMLRELVGKRRLVEAQYIDSVRPENLEKKLSFHNVLRSIGFKVDPLVYDKMVGQGRWEEKGVDVTVATKMLVEACRDRYDIAILVAGDLDYFPAVEGVKDLGKSVEIAFFPSHTSSWFLNPPRLTFDLSAMAERIMRESENDSGEDE